MKAPPTGFLRSPGSRRFVQLVLQFGRGSEPPRDAACFKCFGTCIAGQEWVCVACGGLSYEQSFGFEQQGASGAVALSNSFCSV